MSRALSTLARLHRQAIDRCKEKVAVCVAEGARLEQLAAAARAQAVAETVAAQNDPLAYSMLAAYLQAMRERAAAFDRERHGVALAEDRAREALAAAFLEEKKVSLLIEARAAREAMEERQAETMMLDEIAISRAGFG
jgi:flagellar export protein FliJ